MNEAPVEPIRQNLPALDPSAGMDPQGTGEQNDFPVAEVSTPDDKVGTPEMTGADKAFYDGQKLQGNDPKVIGSETLETDA